MRTHPAFLLQAVRVILPLLLGVGAHLSAAEEWEPILEQALKAEHSQTRQDGLKQVDASSPKGLKAIWAVLGIRDPHRVDWYVREGAYEALSEAKGAEAEKEIERVLKDGGSDLELAKEAIVYSVIWRIRKAVIKEYGGNDDNQIAEVKYKLRKTRGVEYFDLILPVVRQLDPEKKYLKWIQQAFGDKSTRVRRAAITGLTAYPDHTSIPLLLENLKKLEKQKSKQYREWVLNRYALEVLTGQYFHDIVEDWFRWWEIEKNRFTIEKRIEEEKGKEEEGGGRTVVVKKDGVEVKVNMKVAGNQEGYPLLVLPWEGYEVDYFRPYFHGIEEFCRVYYIRMPRIEDYKGLARAGKSNMVQYPTKTLSQGLADIMQEVGIGKFAMLAHGPFASELSMMLAAHHPARVSHVILINPRSAGAAVQPTVEAIRREGLKVRNTELVKASDAFFIMDDGKPKYQASDSAEAGGMSRALHHNLLFGDPTEPETGTVEYFYELPGGVGLLLDPTWSAKSILQGKKTEFPVLIFMGEKALWTPVPDMSKVAALFPKAAVVKMASSAETPFMSETYLFTKSIEDFLRPALLAMKKEKDSKKDEEKKSKGRTKVGK